MIVIHDSKIVDYLLKDPGKKKFFNLFGYDLSNWEQLKTDIYELAENNELVFHKSTPHGKKYEIIGDIIAPNGRTIKIITGWMIDTGNEDVLRFVTAYPA